MKKRVSVWWREAIRPWWLVFSAAFAVATNLDTILTWVGLADRFGVSVLISRVETGTWWIVWLLVSFVILIQSLYRVAVERDAFRAELEKRRRDQALSDLLSDKHEYGIHELLNKPPQPGEAGEAWLKMEDEWLKSVLSIMREHDCTKQQIRHVHTLGLVPVIPLHQDPVVSHQLNMLATRVARIADIARQYGE